MLEEAASEAHLSAQQPSSSQAPRLPAPHADPSGTGDPADAAPEGPRPAVGLIRRIGDRATFDALRRDGRRARRGAVTVVFLAQDARPGTRVAYGVGRRVGSAVVRNRVRRRFRAAVRALDAERGGLAPGAYLVTARPEAAAAGYAELEASLGAAYDALQRVGR